MPQLATRSKEVVEYALSTENLHACCRFSHEITENAEIPQVVGGSSCGQSDDGMTDCSVLHGRVHLCPTVMTIWTGSGSSAT